MHLNALLDLDLVAVESEDKIAVMLELAAPAREAGERRPPGTLEVVLDRSGSMGGDRLESARAALESLVDRLDPADRFGLTVFDHEVNVVVPAEPLGAGPGKDAVKAAIRSIPAGGSTNLSGGYLRGIQEARRASRDGGATLLLLSDGHANAGLLEPDKLATLASTARSHAVTTTTIGIGVDYDESLLSTLSLGGGGNHAFAETGDEAAATVAAEVQNLLDQVAQGAHLIVRPTGDVDMVHLHNDLPAVAIDGGFMVELGDFYAGEERKVLLTVDVPAMAGLGLATVCELELRWVDVGTLDSHEVTVPISVNVVPGDEAAGRVPDPQVRTELAFQDAQRAKREAAKRLREGRSADAAACLSEASDRLAGAIAAAPAALAAELRDEILLVERMAVDAEVEADEARLRKEMEMDWFNKGTRRGRRHGNLPES